MVKFRSNSPGQQPSARPSVAGERVARQSPEPSNAPLEPADTFDLGDEAANAEAAAGEWLGRKAAAKSRRKNRQNKSPYSVTAPKGGASKPSSARAAFGSGGNGPASADSVQAQQDGDQASSSSARPSRKGSVAKAKPKANRKKVLAVVGIALAAVLVACAAVAGFWAWDKWLRYDDAADIQGEWSTAGGSTIVVIDSESIHMPDSVDFAYTMDTKDKTISYSFDQLQGGGSYVFSDDRSTLTITEADGSLTVFVKRSSDTSGEPRVVSAAEAAANAAAVESSSAATADSSADGVSAGASTSEEPDDGSAANELDQQEAAEVADALSSTTSEATPGSNAVQPGSAAAGA